MIDYKKFIAKRIEEITEEIENTMEQGSWTTDVLASLYKIKQFNEDLLDRLVTDGKIY